MRPLPCAALGAGLCGRLHSIGFHPWVKGMPDELHSSLQLQDVDFSPGGECGSRSRVSKWYDGHLRLQGQRRPFVFTPQAIPAPAVLGNFPNKRQGFFKPHEELS